MKIQVIQSSIQKVEADAIIVNLFKEVEEPAGATGAVNRALNNAISDLVAGGDLNGTPGQTAVLYPRGDIPARRVIVVGLGDKNNFNLETVREASAVAAKQAVKLGAVNVASIVHGGGIGGLDITEAAQAVVEGSMLALYKYNAPGKKKGEENNKTIKTFNLVEFEAAKIAAIETGAKAGKIIAEAVSLARTLVNKPGNAITPTALAETAQTMAKSIGLLCAILDEAAMRQAGMGALLSVTQGAAEPAKFIILEHKPVRIAAEAKPIVLVGKGVTFDTGGYTIKTRLGMVGMKGDMAGAAAVMGTMQAIAKLNLPCHVIGLVGAVENVIGPKAYKPNDVFIAKNGVSIEIISADAEGRMTLADALCYADTLNPAAVIDVSTLTSGKVTALGRRTNAIFSNDDALNQALQNAAKNTAEPLWRMPLDAAYNRQIQSDAADIKNSGGAIASAITAAQFLSHFVGNWPWAHIDMAGSAFYTPGPEQTPRSYIAKGATGLPLRTLVDLLRNWNQALAGSE